LNKNLKIPAKYTGTEIVGAFLCDDLNQDQ